MVLVWKRSGRGDVLWSVPVIWRVTVWLWVGRLVETFFGARLVCFECRSVDDTCELPVAFIGWLRRGDRRVQCASLETLVVRSEGELLFWGDHLLCSHIGLFPERIPGLGREFLVS